MATFTLTCPICRITKELRASHKHAKYCSRPCVVAARVRANTKYIGKRHVLIAERALGHSLPRGAVVHHVDWNSRNNSNNNLVICENDAYHYMLHARQRVLNDGGDPNTQKLCGLCKRLMPHSDFQKCKSSGDGLQRKCKACAVELTRQWRLLHK